MNRLLAIVERVYGPNTRTLVFEPLLADRDREFAANRSIALRGRWWFAIAATILTCAPRATFGGLPSSLVLDLGKRAVTFGALAYALQWMGVSMATSRTGVGYPPSIATTVPFLVIPVIWRISVASIPRHQKRLLVTAFATIFIALSASGAENWVVWLGYTASIAWLTIYGWRLGEPWFVEKVGISSGWRRFAMVSSALLVAGSTMRLAMQIGMLTPFWPRYQVIMSLIIAAAVTLATEDVPTESHRTVP